MKTEAQIWAKIDSLDDHRNNLGNESFSEELEKVIMCQIDMLLWVLGDESGMPPLDERVVSNIADL